MKIFALFILLISFNLNKLFAADPEIRIKFSEPFAVFQFVNNLSDKYPDNAFKKLFKASKYNVDEYKKLIEKFNSLNLEYSYDYAEFPFEQKIGGSTLSLLKKNLISNATITDFKLNSIGIVPNEQLFLLTTILEEFYPIYRELVYLPNKDIFEKQISEISKLVISKNLLSYFKMGLKFYNSSWDNTIPFDIVFYPLPNSKGFTASAFLNNAESAIPISLKNYNIVLAVLMHEIFHILYNERPLSLKNEMHSWLTASQSKNSQYAFLLLNEALATSLGNGYVYGKLNGIEDSTDWYNRKYNNLMAKKMYPLVKEYIANGHILDKEFLDRYIQLYDDNFTGWLSEWDNLLTNRTIIADTSAAFTLINRKFSYSSISQYEDNFNNETLHKMANTPITKVVIFTKNPESKIQLLKQYFPELKKWKQNFKDDFIYSVFLKDKTYLIIINNAKKPLEQQIQSMK